MAVTYGNITTGSSSGNNQSLPITDFTVSHNNNGNGTLLAVVAIIDQTETHTTLDLTAEYDGVAMTSVGETRAGLADDIPRLEMFSLASPASGTNDFTLDIASPLGPSTFIDSYAVALISLNDDDGLGANIGSAEQSAGQSGSITATINMTATDSEIFGGAAFQGGDITTTVGTGYTRRLTDLATGANTNRDLVFMLQSRASPGTGNQDFDVSNSPNDQSGALCVEILAAAAGGVLTSDLPISTTSDLDGIATETTQESDAAIATTSALAIATETIQESDAAIDTTSDLAIATELVIAADESTFSIDTTSALTFQTETIQESTFSIDTVSALAIATERTRETTFSIDTTSDLAIVTNALLETTFIISTASDLAFAAPDEITTDLSISTTSDLTFATEAIKEAVFTIAGISDLAIETETIQESTLAIATTSAINIATEGGEQPAPDVERDVDGPPAPYRPYKPRKKLSKNKQRALERERLRYLAKKAAMDEQDANDAMAAINILIDQGVL